MAAVITRAGHAGAVVPAGAGRRADRRAEQYIELAGLMDEVRVGNSLVYREAVGVCAFINPWNYPLHQMIGKLAPALAAGCTVVVKPSQETPLHAFVLAEMIEAIGLPAGVFNLVRAGAKVGEALAGTRRWTWCRSPAPPARVRVSQAAPTVKRCAWSWAASRRC
jgi:aldehyde dehydrogenase (NAD+)